MKVVAVQDYNLSETGSQLISFESHVYGRNKLNIDKELCICFVLFETPVLAFYCKGETMMYTGRSLISVENKSSFRIKPSKAPQFKLIASKKTLSTDTKNVVFDR